MPVGAVDNGVKLLREDGWQILQKIGGVCLKKCFWQKSRKMLCRKRSH